MYYGSITHVFQRGKLHANEFKMLFDSKAPVAKTLVDSETSERHDPAARESPPCTFILLLEACKRRKLSKTVLADSQEFIPLFTESVEELWRGRRVVMSLVMKDLEARQGPKEQKNHVLAIRKNMATCLKIALSEFASFPT